MKIYDIVLNKSPEETSTLIMLKNEIRKIPIIAGHLGHSLSQLATNLSV